MCDCTQWRIYIVGVMAGPECCFQTSLNSELLCIHGVSIHAWTQEMVTCAQVQKITQEMAQVLIPRSNEWQKCSRTGARNGTRDGKSTHVSMVQVPFLGYKRWHKHSHLCASNGAWDGTKDCTSIYTHVQGKKQALMSGHKRQYKH